MMGARFNRLTVIAEYKYGRGIRRHTRWKCRCECGKITDGPAFMIRGGYTKSCGCARKETLRAMFRTHGMSHLALYDNWTAMKQRCENPNNPRYADYGGRGIRVCERWQSFENFYADMGPKPFPPRHSLDRINNDGNYEPGNCRWATYRQQILNQRPRRSKMTTTELNITRPKIALRRFNKWANGRTDQQAEFVRLSIREYELNKGTSAEEFSLRNFHIQFAKLAA